MTIALTLLCRVVRRRLTRGETLETVLADYPRLTEEEKERLMETLDSPYVGGNNK